MFKNLLSFYKKHPDSICERFDLPESLCLFWNHEWTTYSSALRILIVILYYMGIAYICYMVCPYDGDDFGRVDVGNQHPGEHMHLPDDERFIEVAVEQIMRNRRNRRRQARRREQSNEEEQDLSPNHPSNSYGPMTIEELENTEDDVTDMFNTMPNQTVTLPISRESSVSSTDRLSMPLGRPSESQKELAIISTKQKLSSTTVVKSTSSRRVIGEDGDNADHGAVHPVDVAIYNETIDGYDQIDNDHYGDDVNDYDNGYNYDNGVDYDNGGNYDNCYDNGYDNNVENVDNVDDVENIDGDACNEQESYESNATEKDTFDAKKELRRMKKESSAKKPAKLNVKRSAQKLKQPDLWKMYDARTRARAKRMRRNKEAANIDPSKWKIVGVPKYPTNK